MAKIPDVYICMHVCVYVCMRVCVKKTVRQKAKGIGTLRTDSTEQFYQKRQSGDPDL